MTEVAAAVSLVSHMHPPTMFTTRRQQEAHQYDIGGSPSDSVTLSSVTVFVSADA